MDPFERADHEAMGYDKWRFDRTFLMGPAQAYAAKWLESFKDFPPRQKPGSFNLEAVMDSLAANASQ